MGRPSLAEPRRRQIIDGFRGAILRHGLAGASVQRIAADAGVPAGLVHHYFASKEALLIATVDQIVEDARSPIEAELALLDPERALVRALDFLFLEVPADRDRSVLFEEIAALNAEMVAELAALLDRLPDRRGQHAANADLATVLVCLLFGADAQLLSDPTTIDPRRLRRLAGDLVARFRGAAHGKADARPTPDDRGVRGHRARRRESDRRATPAR